jgi:hypothetical protein
MKITDLSGEYVLATVSAIAATVIGAGWAFIRKVFTDSRRLALLEQRQELQHEELVAAIEATKEHSVRVERSNEVAIATQARIVEMLSEMRNED